VSEDKPDVKCDLADLRRVVTLMKQHDLAEVEWEPGKKIRVVRGGVVSAAPALISPAAAPVAAPAAAAPLAPKESRGTEIPSPMVGTFYRSPSPDASPYVEVGDKIGKDSPVCIVEAMKVMNEIKSEIAGEILEILVQNGEPVEFGQPLFLVRPAGAS
jgi:acetyl-CoA carboxylase biotin carboxyl carrier protein